MTLISSPPDAGLHPMQEARTHGREFTDADLHGIRHVCRCGTCSRIRGASGQGATSM